MMPRSRLLVRTLLALLLIGACFAATIAPLLRDVEAAPIMQAGTTDTGIASSTATSSPAALAGANTATDTPTPGYEASLIINEVGWAGTRANANDYWVELYNPNAWDINVNKDWELDGAAGTDGKITLKGIVKAHCFMVLMRRAGTFKKLPTVRGCKAITVVDNKMHLYTTGGILSLYYKGSHQIDSANSNGGAWPAGRGGTSVNAIDRASMERSTTNEVNDGGWITFVGPPKEPEVLVYDAQNFVVKGTPGESNWAYTVTATPSPTATHYKTPTARPPTPFAHMVINEFLPRAGYDWNQDGAVDVYDEFVELKNLGPINAQLNGWRISVISPGGPSSYTISGVTLKPGERIVFYSLKTGLSLYDSGGTVRLVNNSSIVIDARSYGAVSSPDQSTCRLPDGYYWRFPCFPTPGNENSETGELPVPPPVIASQPPPCLLADIVPEPFKQAECYGFGAGVFNPAYWDDQSGFQDFPVPDVIDKDPSTDGPHCGWNAAAEPHGGLRGG